MIAQQLEVSLHQAFVQARAKGHEFISVEHLLLAWSTARGRRNSARLRHCGGRITKRLKPVHRQAHAHPPTTRPRHPANHKFPTRDSERHPACAVRGQKGRCDSAHGVRIGPYAELPQLA
jgi:hypothetical protein